MNSKRINGWSLYVLIGGTAISIIIGILLANTFESPYQYIFGLLSEIIVIVITLGLFFYEINTKIVDLIQDHNLFILAREFVIKSNEFSFQKKYENIQEQLEELAKGHYVLDDLQSVYHDDVESIMSLKKGEKLYSMCPVGSNYDNVLMQFTNKSFQASMDEHYNAIHNGVNVQRLYIFESTKLFNEVPECKAHISEAVNHDVDVRLIFLDDPRFRDAKKLHHDIIIFGNNKVSVGRIGTNSNVDGADVWATQKKIKENYIEYKKLLRLSEGYKKSSS